MNIHVPFKRQVLAGALALSLVAACVPAAAPTAPSLAPTLVPPATLAPTENAAPTPAAAQPTAGATAAAPTPTFTNAVSDLSKLPDPLEGWQAGDRSVPITITEYGDFQ